MSNLKRYYLDDYGVLIEHPNGEYVLHSDYARLKAEVERLRASSFVTAVPVEEYEKLQAEVERLRKAVKIADGAVDCVIKVHDYGFTVSTSYVESLKREWISAKEGKQP